MFLRVLSAMVAADAIDRRLRAQQQRMLAEEFAAYERELRSSQIPPGHYPGVRAEPQHADLRAPERPN